MQAIAPINCKQNTYLCTGFRSNVTQIARQFVSSYGAKRGISRIFTDCYLCQFLALFFVFCHGHFWPATKMSLELCQIGLKCDKPYHGGTVCGSWANGQGPGVRANGQWSGARVIVCGPGPGPG